MLLEKKIICSLCSTFIIGFGSVLIQSILTNASDYYTLYSINTILLINSGLSLIISPFSIIFIDKYIFFRDSYNKNIYFNLYIDAFKKLLIIASIFIINIIIFYNLIEYIFSINNNEFIFVNILFVFFSLILLFNRSILLFQDRYFLTLCIDFFCILLKIFIIFLLIYNNNSTQLLIYGVIFIEFLSALLFYLCLKFDYDQVHKISITIKDIFYKYIIILLKYINIFLLIQFDLIIVKKNYNEFDFINYSIISSVGKIPVFISMAIAFVAYPIISRNIKQNVSSNRIILYLIFLIMILNLTLSLLIFYFSKELILLLYGNKYLYLLTTFKIYSFCFIPVSIIIFLEQAKITSNSFLMGITSLSLMLSLYLFYKNFTISYDMVPYIILFHSSLSIVIIITYSLFKLRKIS